MIGTQGKKLPDHTIVAHAADGPMSSEARGEPMSPPEKDLPLLPLADGSSGHDHLPLPPGDGTRDVYLSAHKEVQPVLPVAGNRHAPCSMNPT
jgi:hypothetical protein